MQVTARRGWRLALSGGLAAGLLAAAWLYLDRAGAWHDFLAWLMATQAGLHKQLAGAMNLVAQQGLSATWPLIGVSLMYGIFHAAGPGHGKAVMATYLGTNPARLRRGLVLSVLSALLQGIVAIALVEIVVGVLDYSLRRTHGVAAQLENVSFALVALLGAMLALRSAMSWYRRRRQPAPAKVSLFSGNGKMQSYCADCGGFHRLGRAHLDQPLSWRTGLPIVLAIGMRPCTGAILVLLVAHALGLRWVGIASVFAMSLGTAATVALLSTAVVSVRSGLARLFRLESGPRAQSAFDLLGLIGGLLILAIGVGLLQQGLATARHPLF